MSNNISLRGGPVHVLTPPPDAQRDNGQHGVFMDIYAAMARPHMRLFGTTAAIPLVALVG